MRESNYLCYIPSAAIKKHLIRTKFKHERSTDPNNYSLSELGIQAQAIFDGQTDEVLQALVNAGSSGGARPKAQLYLNDDNPAYCSTKTADNNEVYLFSTCLRA